jgi:hypothetical protein
LIPYPETKNGSEFHKLPAMQVPEPLFNKRTRAELGHAWNVGVDKSLGALIASLSSRGW